MTKEAFIFPVSYAQQRLWFLDQLEPGNPALNISAVIRLQGQLQTAVLRQALHDLGQRHEALRTTFATIDGQCMQVVSPTFSLAYHLIDLNETEASAREKQALLMAQEAAGKSFDLARGPLWEVTLFRLNEDDHMLLLVAHHIIIDEWSINVFVRELGVLYEARLAGQQDPLPALPIQYADFATWQQEQVQNHLADQFAYWESQLAGDMATMELPADRPRPLRRRYRGARVPITFSPEETALLKRFSQAEDVSLFMTLLAGFKLLLNRYTHLEDMVVLAPVANRQRPELANLIGFFVNTLILRTDMAAVSHFRQLLARVRRVMLDAYANQDVPFDQLIERLHPQRALNRLPLSQIAFNFSGDPPPPLQLGDLSVTVLELERQTAQLDLVFNMMVTEQGLRGFVEYDTDLFDETTVHRFVSHYRRLLLAAAGQPEQTLASLPLLSAAERKQLLTDWNATAVAGSAPDCIHQLFEAQAARTPAATAVIFQDAQITYAQLNDWANHLAGQLQELGVGPEVAVGLYVERGLEMVAGLLAVLKAGGTYVPLDPALPPERLAYILADSRLTLILTQANLASQLPAGVATAICLDAAGSRPSTANLPNVTTTVRGDNLAYVMYTSGSTGVPKGVLTPHRAVVNRLVHQTGYQLTAVDAVLQQASLSFDVSVWEIFGPLVTGARLIIPRPDKLTDTGYLTGLINEHQLTHCVFVPALLELFLDDPLAETCHSLRHVFCGGEALPPALLARFFKRLTASLTNFYGPTEATIDATYWSCAGPARHSYLPIGRPITNVQTYILDDTLQPVPVGLPGELTIGGASLARGYLHQPALTAERFIPDPFGQARGGRLYKTGDLARYHADGNIEFLGRRDTQVQIRGMRVELEEIEAVLRTHTAVKEARVLLLEDGGGQERLVAYIVPRGPIELWPDVVGYFVYDELLYYAMTYDDPKNDSYKVAINRLVKDRVVLDIGTGKDAILARFCVAAGARKVYAIEYKDNTYHAAQNLLRKLGLQEKIILVKGHSTEVELPQKVDVCVSELIGNIGGTEAVAPLLNDAQRFLKEGGVMIPQRSVTKIAAISLPDEIHCAPGFSAMTAYYTQKVFAAVGHPFDIRLCLKNFPKSHIISTDAIFEDLDFRGYAEQEYAFEITLRVQKDGRFDGFILWLNLYTIDDVMVDSLNQNSSWLPIYFPIFDPGVPVQKGDEITAVCRSTFSANQLNPDYHIQGHLTCQTGARHDFYFESIYDKKSFRQTPFYRRLFAADGTVHTREVNRVESEITAANLRAYLRPHLPDHMIPATFMRLEAWPQTPSGKLDRTALPAPDWAASLAPHSPVEPRTPEEAKLAALWCHFLKLEQVSIYDDFFALGGHSLLATRILAHIRRSFQVDLSLRAFFETPTIAGLSLAILEHKAAQTDHDELADLLIELEELPEEEAQRLLAFQSNTDE